MVILFDPINKWIKITSGTEISALTIYNATMDWCDAQDNIVYDVPMAAIGKAPLGGGVYTDSIFILQHGWKIKLYNGTYQFTIFGTIITDDETVRTAPPDSGNVEVIFQVSSQGTLTQIEEIHNINTKVGYIPIDLTEVPTKLELATEHGDGSWIGATPVQVWDHDQRNLTTRNISGGSEEIAEEATVNELKETATDLKLLIRTLKREI